MGVLFKLSSGLISSYVTHDHVRATKALLISSAGAVRGGEEGKNNRSSTHVSSIKRDKDLNIQEADLSRGLSTCRKEAAITTHIHKARATQISLINLSVLRGSKVRRSRDINITNQSKDAQCSAQCSPLHCTTAHWREL